MSTTSGASLDNDWDFAALKASSILPSDDELDGFTLSSQSSELGDDAWGSIDEDDQVSLSLKRAETETPGPEQYDNAQRTPLQVSRSLSVGGLEESETSTVSVERSEHSETSSSFSFRFPDPLDASFEYDERHQLRDPLNGHDNLSDIDTESVSGTEAEAILDEWEPSATFVAPRRKFATPTRSRFYIATAFIVLILGWFLARPLYESWISSPLLESTFSSGGISSFLSSSPKSTREHPALTVPTRSSSAIPSDSTSKHTILQNILHDSTSQTPLITNTRKPLMLEAPPSTGFFIGSWSSEYTKPVGAEKSKTRPSSGSLSLISWSRVTNSLSTTFYSFSKIVIKDIQDLLLIIDEILRFLRSKATGDMIQETSQSFMDYFYEKLGDRHERAKRNARALVSKSMELVKWF